MKFSVLYDNRVFIDPLVTSILWSGDITSPHRTLKVTLKNTMDGTTQAIPIELGKELRLYDDSNRELFRGIIFSYNVDARGNLVTTAYDVGIYLAKSEDSQAFRNMTSAAIVRQLCANYGVPVGEIDATGFVHPRLVLRNMTLWDMMITALTETQKQTGRRFFIFSREGALHLKARNARVVSWILENGTNIIDASYTQSIEDTRTQVKVIGGNQDENPVIATVKDDDLIRRFGVMQHLENAGLDATQSEVRQLAEKLLEQLGKIFEQSSVTTLGNVEAVAGASVYVYEKMTGLVGGYYISADEHKYENGVHTMTLTLSRTDDLPTLEYVPPIETQLKAKSQAAAGGANPAKNIVQRVLEASGKPVPERSKIIDDILD